MRQAILCASLQQLFHITYLKNLEILCCCSVPLPTKADHCYPWSYGLLFYFLLSCSVPKKPCVLWWHKPKGTVSKGSHSGCSDATDSKAGSSIYLFSWHNSFMDGNELLQTAVEQNHYIQVFLRFFCIIWMWDIQMNSARTPYVGLSSPEDGLFWAFKELLRLATYHLFDKSCVHLN